MHGQATRQCAPSADPKAARIAALSEEYLCADPARREEIGIEIEGLISGRIVAVEGFAKAT